MCFTFFFYCQSQCQMLAGFSSENIKACEQCTTFKWLNIWTYQPRLKGHVILPGRPRSNWVILWSQHQSECHHITSREQDVSQLHLEVLSTVTGIMYGECTHELNLWLDTTAFSYFLQGQDIQIFFMQVLCRKFLELTNKNGWTPLYHHAAAIFSNPVNFPLYLCSDASGRRSLNFIFKSYVSFSC